MIDLLWIGLLLPGVPFALLLSVFKQMGDGCGNESGIGEFCWWTLMFAVGFWIAVIGTLVGLVPHWLR